jgi:putative ATP-binding cassette transporter
LPVFDDRLHYQLRVVWGAIKRSPGHWALYILAVAIVVVISATAAAQVVLNAWMQPFYDAIEKKELHAFLYQLVVFFIIAGGLLLLNVVQAGLNQAIRVKLRQLATTDLIGNWTTEKRAARISRAGWIGVNPDQRIHQDAHHLTELTTDLGIGLLQAALLLLSFIGVLWQLSRGMVLPVFGQEWVIPGYMVWAALIYATTGSWFSWRIGRRLVRIQHTRYAREAALRVALVRGAEQADGVALANRETDERRVLEGELQNLLTILWQVVRATIPLTWVTAGYGWVALVFPIIVAAPSYFSGDLTFGTLMMVVGAFNQVQEQLRWFVTNTGVIADWRATLLRVMNFRQALVQLDRFEAGVERFERVEHREGPLVLDDLTVMTVRGRIALGERRVVVQPGERVLLVGRSGSDRGTLFLAIAGLWNWGTGRISLPPATDTMFLSHHPFVPPGTLRSALTNDEQATIADTRLIEVLQRVKLPHLCQSLDRVERWDKELSGEEQQRVAFARFLLNRPKWVISDEAFDLIQDANRAILLSIFNNELADTAVLSMSGAASHDHFYSRMIPLVVVGTDGHVTAKAKPTAVGGERAA